MDTVRHGRLRRTAALACLVATARVAPARAEGPPKEKPRESGIVETTTAHLAQLDVSVSGPRDQVEGLTKDDFEVQVNHRFVTSFLVDRLCGTPGPAAQAAATVVSRPVSYLLYFDHPHLTMAGRQRAMDLAKELVPKLVGGGNRAMIVSNARTVTTIAPFTSDVGELLRAIERLERDPKEWDEYPQHERSRLASVAQTLDVEGADAAIGQARIFHAEDRWRGERNLRRLAMTLGLLTELDPPKAVLYFADTTRGSPGDLYLRMFPSSYLKALVGMAPDVVHALDGVIHECGAHGIRFYAIQAEGLVSAAGVSEAQSAMRTLGLETGGHAFLNGIRGDKIVDRIQSDLSCMYLLSFDPEGLPRDAPLAVKVRVLREQVTAQVRGQIVIQSESSRRTSKLMSAFLAPETNREAAPIRAGLIPLGFQDGSFSALVQVAVAGAALPAATWDLGTSLVSRERVREEGSGRIAVNVAGAPVILEREMRFSPGPYELVSVAQELTAGQVSSRRDEGSWPDPDAAEAVVGPIAVVQRVAGAFLRDDKAATSGNLVVSGEDPVRTDQPVVLVGIVCRSRGMKEKIVVERTLVGESQAAFPAMEIDMSEDRCAVFQDLIHAKTMTEGLFRYEVRVLRGGTEIARGERAFPVVRPGPQARPGG